MQWHAETDQGGFGSGTLLAIYSTPVASRLSAGASIAVHLNGAPITIAVDEIGQDYLIVETSNKSKWKLVEATKQQLVFAAGVPGGAHATYWVVKEQI